MTPTEFLDLIQKEPIPGLPLYGLVLAGAVVFIIACMVVFAGVRLHRGKLNK